MIRRIFVLSVIFLSALFSFVTDIPVFAQSKGSDEVTLRMSWFPYADYAMYTIGIKKGFYQDQGIEVKIAPTKGSALATKVISIREAEFASASADATLMARIKGMPLKVLATLHQTSPVSIFSLEKIGIKELKDLEGKSLASDPASLKHKQFIAFCKKNGIDIEKINILPIRGSNFVHILEGRADSMLAFGYIGDAMLRKKGYMINEIKLKDYGIDIYSISLITNDNLIKENPDLVRRFVAATVKSWNYAASHPEETVDAYVEAYPELKKEDQFYQVTGVISLAQSEYTKRHGLGYQSKEKWQKTQDLLYEQGVVDKEIDVEEVYTNQFLP